MSSMKCTIPGVNLKVFGRAIQSMSKIGDELYFEPLEDGLFLRTVNSCRSAYGYFQFSPSFFLHYIDGVSGSDGDTEEEALRCKIGMKSVMTVFKSMSTIDKTVEKCRISLNMQEARLVFQMYCRHGIVKTHNLAFIECESLQAIASKDLCPNKITTQPKVVCDAVVNFQSSQEEITLIVRPDFLALKNYVEDEPDKAKVIHTELTLDPEEFDHYQVGVDTEVTFCLKEFRAILAFVDITDLPLGLHFESAGRPITFSVCSDLSFEANFVLATLPEQSSSQVQRPTQRQSQAAKKKAPHRPDRVNGHSSKSLQASHSSSKPTALASTSVDSAFNDMNDVDDEDLSRLMDISVPEDSINITASVPQRPRSKKNNNTEPIPQPRISKHNNSTIRNQSISTLEKNVTENDMLEDECPTPDRDIAQPQETRSAKERHSVNNQTRHFTAQSADNEDELPRQPSPPPSRLLSLRSEGFSSADTSPQIPLQTDLRDRQAADWWGQDADNSPGTSRQTERRGPMADPSGSDADASPQVSLQADSLNSRINTELSDNSEEEDSDEVPGTPPSKKFKALLFGTQSSTQPSQSQSRPEILALDSDDDS